MNIWRLVAGILSIILFVFVTMQSCAAGLSNAMAENGGISGSIGLIVAILLLAGGIVSICTRKNLKKGGSIALLIIFGLAALIGFTGHGNYSDLVIWSAWCLINAVLALVCIVKKK